MTSIKRCILWNVAIVFALTAAGHSADQALPVRQETPNEGHVRAGCPQVIAPYAQPSNTPDYFGYYVGGGAAVHGQARSPNEGTWGWDYGGLLPKHIALNWWHGASPGRRRVLCDGPQVIGPEKRGSSRTCAREGS